MIKNYLDPDGEDEIKKSSYLEPCFKCRYKFPSNEEQCPLCGWDHDNKKYIKVNTPKIILILLDLKEYWKEFFKR